MPLLPIIHSEPQLAEAERVAATMNAAGVPTRLFAMNGGELDRLLPVIEGSASGEITVQAWLLPLAALEVEEHHRDKAAAARVFLGIPRDPQPAWRLLILLDADAALAPQLPNTIIVGLEALLGGEFDVLEFADRFGLMDGKPSR